jgi:predicted phosphodiesterase
MEKMKKYLYFLIILLILGVGFFSVEKFILKRGTNTPAVSTNNESAPPQKVNSFFGIFSLSNSSTSNDTTAPAETPPINQSQTASAPVDDNASFSFGIFGDTKEFSASNPNGNLEKAVAQVKGLDLKAVFVMGDLIKSCDDGCEKKFNDWKSVMEPILSKTYEVVGNHDRTGGDSDDAVWQKVFNLPQNGPTGYKELAYSFDIGNSHFAVLDSEKPKTNIVDSNQRNWLDQDLAASSKLHKFVFYHEPAFQVAQDAEDGLDAKPAERDALWNIIKKYKVDAVFNGHAHIYARKNIDGIEQIVVGDTDSTNDDLVQPGLSDFGYKGKSYAIVTVTGNNVNLKLFTVDGKQVDSFNFN